MTGKNIEIKARIADLESVLSRIRAICKKKPVEIHQKDTFFHCTNGRIKLREFDDETGELIYYKRQNTSGPKLSEYHRYESKNPGELLASLTSAYGVLGVVQKKRILYLIGQTRVHVDHVKYLGEFVELEVVLKSDQSLKEGTIIAEELMSKLGINNRDLIESAYIDLLHE